MAQAGASGSPSPRAGSALAAATQADTRVKIVPKPVPCVPCPCECPEVRAGAASVPGVGQPGLATATLPSQPPEEPPGKEPEVRTPRVPLPQRSTLPPPPPRITTGTITGEVIVRDRGGKEKADRSDVVIYIEKMPKKYAALKRVRRMAQRDKTFAPHLLAVTKGSMVEFPNEDKLFHNVFSLSEGATFDLGLYRAGMSKSWTFERAGLVDVYCNIHPNMWAQILVLENPFYAVTGKDGGYEIPKVPAGTYKLVAWVSGGDPVSKQITVTPNGKVDARFELKEGSTSKPHMNKFNQPYGRYKG